MMSEPSMIWKVALPGNVPLTFTNRDAMRNRIAQLRQGGHTDITIRCADVVNWRDEDQA